jgi:hypothetical protein
MGKGEIEKWTYRVTTESSADKKPIYHLDVDSATQELCVRHNLFGFSKRKRYFCLEKMKGDGKRRATIFKKGNKFAKGKQCNNLNSGNNEANSVQYVRPSPEEADLLDQNPMQPLVIEPEGKPDEPVKTYKMLRSIMPKRLDITKQGQTATDIR